MENPFQSPAIEAAFAGLEPNKRRYLLALRDLIFDIAADLPVGAVTETLKWGQPSYITTGPRAGTPIRLGLTKTGDVAIFTHCQSTVMSDFRALAPADMRFDGNRALHLDPHSPLPTGDITPLIRAALTYRL